MILKGEEYLLNGITEEQANNLLWDLYFREIDTGIIRETQIVSTDRSRGKQTVLCLQWPW